MKKGIHPDYHFVEVQLNDGTTYKTRTTYGTAGQKITLDIDPTTHPAWTGGQQQLMDRGGRLTRFNKKFAGFVKALSASRTTQNTKTPPVHPGGVFVCAGCGRSWTSTPKAWARRIHAGRARRRTGSLRLRRTECRPAGRCGDKDCRCAPADPAVPAAARRCPRRSRPGRFRGCPGDSGRAWHRRASMSPSRTARCTSSQLAACIRRVVTRMLSPA